MKLAGLNATAAIIDVVRSRRSPPVFAGREEYRGELLAALTIAGIDATGDATLAGGHVDVYVEAGAQAIGICVCPPGPDADAEVVRRLRRLAAAGDLDALILLTADDRHLGIAGFRFACPVLVENLPGWGATSGAEGERGAEAA